MNDGRLTTTDPLTAKGREIHRAMTQEYGEKKGEQVFHAAANAGTITGVDVPPPPATPPADVAPKNAFILEDYK